MKDLLVPVAHLFTTIAKLLGPGGARAVVADTFLWTARSRAQKKATEVATLYTIPNAAIR